MIPDDAKIRVRNDDINTILCGPYRLYPKEWVEVPVSFLQSYGEAPNITKDFSGIANYLQTTDEDGTPVFDFRCPLSAVDGYGRHALDIWRGLNDYGVKANLRGSDRYVDAQHLDPELMRLSRANRRNPPSYLSVTMSVPYDPAMTQNESIVKLAITQFECDRIPEKYIEFVNQCDALITTSNFQVPIWRECGLRIPIHVLTPGVDTQYFSYKRPDPDGTFKVLLLGALSPRKNVEGAIRIFQAASGGREDWRLTIKSRGYLRKEWYTGDPRIQVIEGDAPPGYIKQLYETHDCLLWPSKGEGVGLPPLEAMSCGMELVCSQNSGMLDYLRSENSYPIKMAGKVWAAAEGEAFSKEFVNELYGDPGNYWIPDEDHGAKQLRKCFDNWADGKGRGERAAKYVRARHTLRDQAASVWEAVRQYHES